MAQLPNVINLLLNNGFRVNVFFEIRGVTCYKNDVEVVVMIAYDLQCGSGHTFEGWFKDHKAFEDQQRRKLVACPECNDTSVVIVPSTFSIKSGPSQPGAPKASGKTADQLLHPHKMAEFLEKHFEDVGARFAKEALKMHYGVSEKRNIRGTSTKNEEDLLEKEGIKFFKIPVPRHDS